MLNKNRNRFAICIFYNFISCIYSIWLVYYYIIKIIQPTHMFNIVNTQFSYKKKKKIIRITCICYFFFLKLNYRKNH